MSAKRLFIFLTILFSIPASANCPPCEGSLYSCYSTCGANPDCQDQCYGAYLGCAEVNCPTAPAFVINDLIVVTTSANLYVGSKVVGKVKKGERYRISGFQGQWVTLKREDETPINGWLQTRYIAKISF